MTAPAFLTRDQAAARAATPAWTPPPGTLKAITLHLTPLAPGCEAEPLSAPARWRTLSWRTPGQALFLTLRRLRRRADQVALRHVDGLDGVEIHDGTDPAPGCAALLAIIFDAPVEALRTAHAALLRKLGDEARPSREAA